MFAAILLCAFAFAQPPAQPAASQAPKPAAPQWQEYGNYWNSITNRLAAMAEDFPEDKYDFKAKPEQRSFAENLLHVASDSYRNLNAIRGSKYIDVPENDFTRQQYKIKADVVKLMKQLLADGNALLKEQGDAGLARTVKSPYGNSMRHVPTLWTDAIEHSGEHYGQLVVYYRLNDIVPPASRPR
jgi:uncharacterized damage-inducible protein DinB